MGLMKEKIINALQRIHSGKKKNNFNGFAL